MQLDNKTKASKIRLLYMAVPFFIVVSTAIFYLGFESKDFKWAVIAGFILLGFFIIMSILRFYYISFYAGPDKIRLRYKSLSPFPSDKNSIVIKSPDFHNYKLKTSLFKKKQSLVLYVNTPGGIAEFDKISLFCMSKTDIEKIKKALDLIVLMNKNKK